MTLLELLIAVAIFAFLTAVLAGLIKISFDLWRGSERQGDITERQQVILEYLTHDLQRVYAEKETKEVIQKVIEPSFLPDYISTSEPSFYTDLDQSGNNWLYLVLNNKPATFIPDTPIDFNQPVRVMYYIKNNPDGTSKLCRIILDKPTALSFFKERRYERDDFPESSAMLTIDDVLYFGLHLKADGTQITTKWNSLPKDAEFMEPSYPKNILVPEQNLPRAAEIELSLKSTIFPEANMTLIADGDKLITVSKTRGLPAPPEYVKIDREWLYYTEFSQNKFLKIEKRPARNSKSAYHSSGTPVLYGQTVKQLIYLTTSGK